MSDLMLYAVLRMPYEMAMSSELSRRQFYIRVQEAADRLENAEAALAEQSATAPTVIINRSNGNTCRHGLSACLVCMNNRVNSAPVAQGKEADHG